MKILIGFFVVLLCVYKIESRKSISRNHDRDDYGPDDMPTMFDFADDSDSEEDDEESQISDSEEQILEALLKLIESKYQSSYSKPKKPHKKDEDVYYKPKDSYQPKNHKNRQQKNRYNNDRNHGYESKRPYQSNTSCKFKITTCLKLCDGEYRCRSSCNARTLC